MLIYVIIGIVVFIVFALVAVYIVNEIWRRSPYGKLEIGLYPLKEKLRNATDVTQEEVLELARVPEQRQMLHQLLRDHDCIYLFPDEYLSQVAQAEAALAYWLLGPMAYKAAPTEMEYVETVQGEIWGSEAEFCVFRYKQPGSFANDQGWIFGLAGPYLPDDKPYRTAAKGFSVKGRWAHETTADELLELYISARNAEPEPFRPIDDPLFGEIESDGGAWVITRFFVPTGAEIGILVEAGKNGPSQAQRDFYQRIEKQYRTLLAQYEAAFLVENAPDVGGTDVRELFQSLNLNGILIPEMTGATTNWEMHFETDLNPHMITANYTDWEYTGDTWDG